MPSEAAFRRCARLLKQADFARVFAQPGRSADSAFTVLGFRRASGSARLGLAISRKAVPTAVGRNRLKRLVRESFRRHRSELDSLDLVVMARSSVAGRSNPELFGSLHQHWIRIVRRCVPSSPS